MKPGDLVRIKMDDIVGLITAFNTTAAPTNGRCWYVFMAEYGALPFWEHELELISEGR